MVFDPHVVLQAEGSADFRSLRKVDVVDGVGKIEACQGGASVLPGEQPGRKQGPENRIGVVVPHENGDFEPDVHAHAVEQVAQEHRPGIDVEDLVHTVVHVVVQRFLHPPQRVAVGLADAAEVARDGLGPAEMDV